MASNIFEDLTILLCSYPDVSSTARQALVNRLEECGGVVRTRNVLSAQSGITHIVVQRTQSTTPEAAAAGDATLRGLFDKIEQVLGTAMSISPAAAWRARAVLCNSNPCDCALQSKQIVQVINASWVYACLEQNRRVGVSGQC